MDKKPKVLERKIVAESQIFGIEQLHLEFANGERRHYERIRGSSNSTAAGSVMIIPQLDAQTFLIIREYAAGVEDYVLGFPKGKIERDEDLLITAERELKEEVGYGARQFKHLGRFSANPGYSRSMMDFVLATELYPQRLETGDEPEEIEVIEWSLDNLDELLAHPEFHEARSVAAILLLMREQDG